MIKKMNEKTLVEILQAIMKKRRFKDIEELKTTIKRYMEINLVDYKNYDIRLSYKPEYEMGEYPEETDYLLIGSIEGNNEVFDFDLYYAKTRAEGIYITEFIVV